MQQNYRFGVCTNLALASMLCKLDWYQSRIFDLQVSPQVLIHELGLYIGGLS